MKIGGRYLLSAFRALAILVAAVQLQSLDVANGLPDANILLIIVIVYSLVKFFQPSAWFQKSRICTSLIVLDVGISSSVLFLTGGLLSPFLLYSLAPILSAALFLEVRVTSTVGATIFTSVVLSHVANPWYIHKFDLTDSSFMLIYLTTVFLIGSLPYLINANLKQRLQSKFILTERHRLSREIHDGMAQTLSGLSWQAQLLEQKLKKSGIELDEVKDLISLTEEARHDARESLELLREYTGNGEFITNLRQYLQHLRQSTGLIFTLNIDVGQYHLTPTAEIELLRICQEALSNVRKHSSAHRVAVSIVAENSSLKISITDDGRGFDSVAFYRFKPSNSSHGLTIMQERAESIGGRLRIISLPRKGTEVQVTIPAQS